MIFQETLKKAIFISLLGHIAVFSIFNFSFGKKVFKPNFNNVYFWGAILNRSDLTSSLQIKINSADTIFLNDNIKEATKLGKAEQEYFFVSRDYSRPALAAPYYEDKAIFTPKLITDTSIPVKKSSVIIFYPPLPYNFILYFKDRQTAHIELMFNIISSGKRSSIMIKRRISSGNLEADLLSMRYISRYLFIQQRGFIPNNWQAVKIDLSPKGNDQY